MMIFPNNGNRTVEITKSLKKIRRLEPPKNKQQLVTRAAIMGYELGDLQQFAVYNARSNMDPQILGSYRDNAKLALSDLLIQARMVCMDMGWDFDEVQELGLQHLQERMSEIQQDGFAEKQEA
ncbi:hypothetical protein Metev_0636 [Methanohalobium evestigatum Z-7303]|uniref:Uncharacterized protein n=1 Tax=Methanohalobium evestigatum (strain ATCC BAA-1072 / DSM 3721 / NBRC 107634 / OCM 161 / Z-7303) TaxID=644295 RepID=D7E8K0_METEZ|nr:hypothetical protein [Methanohalobium evestigatum]ADI73542.1 hypothetical protein Metev_0636 [Methanohalobium evestigatum Z-7303]